MQDDTKSQGKPPAKGTPSFSSRFEIYGLVHSATSGAMTRIYDESSKYIQAPHDSRSRLVLDDRQVQQHLLQTQLRGTRLPGSDLDLAESGRLLLSSIRESRPPRSSQVPPFDDNDDDDSSDARAPSGGRKRKKKKKKQ